jgi:pimeloyl-ACP methyl ester carboxylesterase
MTSQRLCRALGALALAISLVACEGDDGRDGAPGADGAPGSAGATSLISQTELPAFDANCPSGGVRIDSGIDGNSNGVLDADEIDQTSFICNGGPAPIAMPIVFVHGQSGSAQQFESQAMRFTSNGYPQDLLFSFEYDTSIEENPREALDAFIDDVLAGTGMAQVYAIGHSRGTSVWTEYLDDETLGGSSKVARYVSIDGRAPEELPGGVDTIGIWSEWNTAGSGFNRRQDTNAQIGPDADANYYFGNKSHTEVATSAEAFEILYEFLTGVPAGTTAIEPEDNIELAGRVTLFPQNFGYPDGTLEVWELDAATGQRTGEAPIETFAIGGDGDFGPFEAAAETYYEFALTRRATESFPVDTVHHFYFEPFVRDNHFLRLQTSLPGTGTEAFIPRAGDAASLVITRQKEFWGDQGAEADELFVDGTDILQDGIAPRALGQGSGVNLAVFAYDDGQDKQSGFEKGELFPFSALTFLTAVDVYIPATADASTSTEMVLVHRGGDESRIALPAWPSDVNRVSVSFRDDL